MTTVVPLRPEVVERQANDVPPSTMGAALDQIEQAADDAGVLYVDVRLQLALARYLARVVESIQLGTEPTVAQVHAIRELRLVTTELRTLVVDYGRTAGARR